MAGLIDSLIELRHEVSAFRKRDIGESPWDTYDSLLSSYDGSFAEILPPGGFAALTREISNRSGKCNVLNLFGQTGALAELSNRGVLSHGLAVTLADVRDEDTKGADTDLRIKEVAGDVFRGKTWKDIDEASQGWGGFDVVLFRPLQGVTKLSDEDSRPIFLPLFSRVYKRLSYGGSIFALIRGQVVRESGAKFFDFLRRQKVDVISGKDMLRGVPVKITKTPDSPESMPRYEF